VGCGRGLIAAAEGAWLRHEYAGDRMGQRHSNGAAVSRRVVQIIRAQKGGARSPSAPGAWTFSRLKRKPTWKFGRWWSFGIAGGRPRERSATAITARPHC